ncbi:uncharacterized protein LOC110028181 [Phalaenopsis equestris]|uniref:uncharacterized protein LOC110028181 n=1 Tax=Phalaenopsis equestris TaxID=78828 RepID=UPI0009E2B2D0|nr:uncharacterized protein LOC110028181 [Phalaenopsis equestris]
MGKHSCETGALLHSSIALLQERFRELQRIREMREKRELLRLFSETKCMSSSAACIQPRWFYYPELWNPSKLTKYCHDGGEGRELQDEKVEKFSEAEIDTSLHL